VKRACLLTPVASSKEGCGWWHSRNFFSIKKPLVTSAFIIPIQLARPLEQEMALFIFSSQHTVPIPQALFCFMAPKLCLMKLCCASCDISTKEFGNRMKGGTQEDFYRFIVN
jgi:hypothetical protein